MKTYFLHTTAAFLFVSLTGCAYFQPPKNNYLIPEAFTETQSWEQQGHSRSSTQAVAIQDNSPPPIVTAADIAKEIEQAEASLYGRNGNSDPEYAITTLKKYAEQGNANAQYLLAQAYLLGTKDIPVDEKLGLMWMKRASAQGNAYAAWQLGNFYEKQQQTDIANGWFEQAASLGMGAAQLKLAYAALDSRPNPQYATAVQWLQKAAAQNLPEAQLLLMAFYQKGIYVPQDVAKANQYYQAAKANPAFSYGAYELGRRFIFKKALPYDAKDAVFWLEQATKKNLPQAYALLGDIYYQGMHNIPKDYERAYNSYFKAAQLNFPYAQYSLGIMFATGIGVKQNFYLSTKWLNKASHSGNKAALYALAQQIARTHDKPEALSKAYALAEIATDELYSPQIPLLERWAKHMDPQQFFASIEQKKQLSSYYLTDF